MDMREEWLHGLWAWASANGNVQELWLFGSRADGHARPDSDVDIAIALMPAAFAYGNYVALGDGWQRELEAIVGRHVSLEATDQNTDFHSSMPWGSFTAAGFGLKKAMERAGLNACAKAWRP
jgi:predicted nucleotidyltransferase